MLQRLPCRLTRLGDRMSIDCSGEGGPAARCAPSGCSLGRPQGRGRHFSLATRGPAAPAPSRNRTSGTSPSSSRAVSAVGEPTAESSAAGDAGHDCSASLPSDMATPRPSRLRARLPLARSTPRESSTTTATQQTSASPATIHQVRALPPTSASWPWAPRRTDSVRSEAPLPTQEPQADSEPCGPPSILSSNTGASEDVVVGTVVVRGSIGAPVVDVVSSPPSNPPSRPTVTTPSVPPTMPPIICCFC
mmetsp:Transcript_100717/g.262557  ORF Transcript_100717/g.262557 Transcript_100717/m.262557 type:complete len:248 (-) Transcript_100717:298-1041(-)